MNNVSVVILNYNGEKLLQQFLPSVVHHSGNAKIIVADNGSTDHSADIVKSNFPSVRLLELGNNYGFCGGYNRALKQIQSEYYVLLNSDVEVTPGWLGPLIKLLSKNSKIAVVQPKILSYKQRDQFEYAGAGGGLIDSFGYPFCRGRLFDFTEKDNGQYNDTCEVFWASGACMALRAKVYLESGGFDETFFAHMEEIDLCWRVQRMGLKVFYCGESTVYHLGAGTLFQSNPKKTYYNFRNGLSLLYKHLPAFQLIYKLPIRLFLDYLASIKFILGGDLAHAKSVFRAHYDFFSKGNTVGRTRRELKSKYPFSSENVYRGLVPLEYYLLGRKKVVVNNPK